MKKRVLSLALALLLLVMIPAETAMAMPATYAENESMITLVEETAEIEEVVEDEVDDVTTEEVVEDATAEPTEVSEEEVTVEPTQEPVEESIEDATAEPTETPAEDATAVPEMTPETEATVEPTEEATIEPIEEPVEEVTAEPTEEPSATPTATPSVAPVKKDVVPDGRDLTKKAVGSNGIQYEDVEYLSLATVNSLPKEAAAYYYELCDGLAESFESGAEIKNVVLYTDKDGNIGFSMQLPVELLYSEEIQNQFLDEEVITEEAVEEQVEEDIEESVEDIAETDETEVEESIEPESTPEVVLNIESESEEITEEITEDVANDVVEESIVEEDSDTVEEELEVKSDVIIAENMELAMANQVKEELIGTGEIAELNTLHKNSNYFKNQLSSSEKKLYDAAYKAIVKNGKNSFTYSGNIWFKTSDPFLNAVSALVNTYPNSFNWMNKSPYASTNVDGIYYFATKKGTYTMTIPKSGYYSSSLDSQATAKVNTIVADAKKYAKSYPQNQIWAMVNYFDNWICQNNYYNYDGTYNYKASTDVYYYCHSSYGVLLKGYGVCESYALAMTALLDAAGIRNLYVTGKGNGGGHAWNYVQMPDGKWYLLDSTWNDVGSGSDKAFFLIGSRTDAKQHKAQGRLYKSGKNFSFNTLKKSDYNSNTEKDNINALRLNKTKLSLKPGESFQMKLVDSKIDSYYLKKYGPVWASSNTAVATISSSGKIKAIKPGATTISYTICGVKKSCTLYVYKFTGLKFANNSKTSYSYTYANPNTVFDGNDVFYFNIAVNQKDKAHTAAQIQSAMGLKAPKVKSSNTKVAIATATLSGDTIKLTVTPKKIGSATITVSFAGKTATLKLKNRYNIATNSGWFDYTKITAANNTVYSGKAITPKVKKTTAAPKGLEYSVSYKNNKNAGTATVTIKGKGSYTGKIEKTFKIVPKSITTAKFKSCSTSKTYNGAAQKATTTVMMGKTKLKAGKDYIVNYNNSTTVPTNVGKYTVKIVGTGNYTGTVYADNVIATKVYEIKPLKLEKATITCTASRKYTGSTVKAPTVTVKYGKKTIPATQYTITYKNSSGAIISAAALKDKGTYKVIITPKGSNFVAGTKTQVTKTFKIVKK